MFIFTGKVASTPTGRPGVGWDTAAEVLVYAESKHEAGEKVLKMMGEPHSGSSWSIAWSLIEEVQ